MSAVIWTVIAAIWLFAPPMAHAAGTGYRLAIKQEWKGSSCGSAEAKQVVIRTREDWAALWQAMHRTRMPTPPLPEVDFSRQLVIAAFLGERTGGGASIEIAAVRQQGDQLLVDVRTTEPSPETLRSMRLTQPCHVAVVNTTASSVQFRSR